MTSEPSQTSLTRHRSLPPPGRAADSCAAWARASRCRCCPRWRRSARWLPSRWPAAAGAAAAAPLRMAFVTFPNGCNLDHWWPTGEGETFELNKTMAPLASVKQQIQVISGLDHLNAEPGPDGAGDHARANATLLTGVRARKTAGPTSSSASRSTRSPPSGRPPHAVSLARTHQRPRPPGQGCDSGYACAYQFNVSWRSEVTPMPPEAESAPALRAALRRRHPRRPHRGVQGPPANAAFHPGLRAR